MPGKYYLLIPFKNFPRDAYPQPLLDGPLSVDIYLNSPSLNPASSPYRVRVGAWVNTYRQPKPQLCDDHLAKYESWRNYNSLYGNVYDRSQEQKKKVKISIKKNLTLLSQCIACYLTAYYVEKNPFQQVIHFQVYLGFCYE